MRSKRTRYEIKRSREVKRKVFASVGYKIKFEHNYSDLICEISGKGIIVEIGGDL